MIQLKEGELLSNHTTFRIGGAAKYFAVPKNEEEIMEAVDFAIVKGLPHYILGKGSNVLFPDEGYSGVVIEIGAGMEKVERIGDAGGICSQRGARRIGICRWNPGNARRRRDDECGCLWR